MTVRNAELEDMKQLGHIMAVSFRTAFADFVSQQTMDTYTHMTTDMHRKAATVVGGFLDEIM